MIESRAQRSSKPAAAAPIDPRASLAMWLRAGRARRKLSLDDVARITKIQPRTLEKLEAGTLDGLPAEVFVRGFLRSFARCVGLDEGEALERFRACAADAPPAALAFVETLVAPMTPEPEPVAAEPVPAEPAPAEVVPAEPVPVDVASAEAAPAVDAAPASAAQKKKRAPRKKSTTATARSRKKKMIAEAAPESTALAEVTATAVAEGELSATERVERVDLTDLAIADGTATERVERFEGIERFDIVAGEIEVAGVAPELTGPVEAAVATTETTKVSGEVSPGLAETTEVSGEVSPGLAETTEVGGEVASGLAETTEVGGEVASGLAETTAATPVEPWQPTMPPVAPTAPWRRFAATAPIIPSLVIDDADPDRAEREQAERAAAAEPHRVSFLPPILLDQDRSARQGGLTLAVIILLIAATLTLSYLMRRPGVTGDGVTMADAPSMLA
jgi:hypothetical protein